MYNTPTWNPHLPEMPVDKDGNVLHYPDNWEMRQTGAGWEVWHQPFYAHMTLDGTISGRSAKYYILKDDKTGKHYPMFVSDLFKMINERTVTIEAGILHGWWTGSKKGSNYGIKTVKEPS